MDLALNNLQRLICHKTQQTKTNQTKEMSLMGEKETEFGIYEDLRSVPLLDIDMRKCI